MSKPFEHAIRVLEQGITTAELECNTAETQAEKDAHRAEIYDLRMAVNVLSAVYADTQPSRFIGEMGDSVKSIHVDSGRDDFPRKDEF